MQTLRRKMQHLLRARAQRPPRQRQSSRNPHEPGQSRPEQELECHGETGAEGVCRAGVDVDVDVGRQVFFQEGEEAAGFVVDEEYV